MANETVQLRVKPELKAEAEALFSAMGMSTAEAIRIFLQQSINVGGLPFQPCVKQPNAGTLEAIKELRGEGGKHYTNTDEMYEDLGI